MLQTIMTDQSTSTDATPAETAQDSADVDVSALADEVESATLDAVGDDEDDGIAGIIEGIIDGEIPPEQADDEIRAWVNDQVNIPFIGEAAESRILQVVQGVVKNAVVSVLRSL